MKLEGVIICVDYSDFLAHSLPFNKGLFDRLVVVTDCQDEKTKWLCNYYHVECIQTNVFYENGDKFNKAKGINAGLDKLSKSGWVMHLDADIYLPPLTRYILGNLPLDSKVLYGADRLMCPDYLSWIKYIENPSKIQEAWVYIHPTAFPVGVRIAEYNNFHQGYTPIGYLQLWNPQGSGVYKYPDIHGKADRTDVLFAKLWTRPFRQLLPEILCIHLESEGLTLEQMGKNWNGRKTKEFSYKSLIPTRGYKPTCLQKIKNCLTKLLNYGKK